MGVELLAIKFNHDPTSATSDALNIRKNAREFIAVPEWRRGDLNPEDSVAAYAIRETRGETVTIQAKFASTEDKPGTVEVRAVLPPVPKLPDWWLSWLPNLLWLSPALYYFYYNYLSYVW